MWRLNRPRWPRACCPHVRELFGLFGIGSSLSGERRTPRVRRGPHTARAGGCSRAAAPKSHAWYPNNQEGLVSRSVFSVTDVTLGRRLLSVVKIRHRPPYALTCGPKRMRALHAVLALATLDLAASVCLTPTDEMRADKSKYTCSDECCSQNVADGAGTTRDGFITTDVPVTCTSAEACPKGQSCCSWDNEQGEHTTGRCGEMCTSTFIPFTNCPDGCEPDSLPVVGGRRSILFAAQPVRAPTRVEGRDDARQGPERGAFSCRCPAPRAACRPPDLWADWTLKEGSFRLACPNLKHGSAALDRDAPLRPVRAHSSYISMHSHRSTDTHPHPPGRIVTRGGV